MKKICVLTTGGTIEKSYSESDGSLLNRESILHKKLISRLRLPASEIEVREVLAKDSLQMVNEDRQKILEAVIEAFKDFDSVLVLHGTDTLDKTMKYCEGHLTPPDKPVVFTGAMVPAGFDDSDALQNFTEALFSSQNVSPGYYLSFHGQLFKGTNVRKNRETNTFEYE